MFRAILLISTLLLFCFGLDAQQADVRTKVSKRQETQLMRLDNADLKRSNFKADFYQELGLQSAEDLQLKQSSEGLNGWTRMRMQQEYQGLRVVGASYILHEKEGKIKKASGDLLPYINIGINPSISKSLASQASKKYTNEKLLSQTQGEAVVLPDWDIEQVELVVMDKAYPKFSGNYTLAYHVIISNLEGKNQYRESVYVDANNAEIIEAISEIAHTSVVGIAQTKYYGEQQIITDSINANLFLLRDDTRGAGIITLNGSLDDFEDEDNFWDNFGNKEEVGTDAHYCSAAYYDYMVDNFNWSGLDGQGFELRSRVYGDERNTVNATWNGSYSTFFSGDCDQFGPLTTLDVVGHEFAHGFTDFTSDLIYRNESGALNESISDILGKALELAYDPDNFNWLIGDKFLLTEDGNHFRDMSNPNNKNHPKLYAGEHWEFGTRDNGGVHINSGVFNFWYYLLTEGQADVNEIGVAYDVNPIGIDKATAIVFTMNTAYLTESSTYTKAVIASIETVKDLYGDNSPEMESVLEAWKAVGLYPDSGDYDVSLELVEDRPYVCADALGDFPVEVMVFNVGQNPYLVGDLMDFSYSIEGDLEAEEQLVLSADFMPGDTLFYTFSQSPTMLSAGDNFDLAVAVEASVAEDPNNATGEIVVSNNTDEARITTTESAGLDVRFFSVTISAISACQTLDQSRVRMSVQNTGCELIPEGEYPLTIVAAGSEYVFDVELGFDLRPGVFGFISEDVLLPAEIANGDLISARFSLPDDVNPTNDEVNGQYLFLEPVTVGFLESFDSFDLGTSTEVFIDPDFRADAAVGLVNGNEMLIISGVDDEPFSLENCGERDLFFRENFQKTEIEMCVNTVGVVDPVFSFDLIQYRADEPIMNVDPSFAVMTQVTIDGEAYPIISDQAEGETVRHDFPLPDDFSDDIVIEVMTLRGDGVIGGVNNFQEGDFAMIDNIQITSGTVSASQVDEASDVFVYPNPSSSVFNFVYDIDGEYDLTIYDGLGRLVYQAKGYNTNATWDASRVEEGIYFFEVQNKNGGLKQGKVVVSKY